MASPPLPGDFKHGFSGYTNRSCRCDICTEANAQHRREVYVRQQERKRVAKERAQRKAEGHGKYETYLLKGCRCDKCTMAYLNKCARIGMLDKDWWREYKRTIYTRSRRTVK